MSSPPPGQRQSSSKIQSPGSGHHGLPRQVSYTPTPTPNLGPSTTNIHKDDIPTIIKKHQEIQEMLEDYKEKLEQYKNSEHDDYDSLLQDYKIIKKKLKEFGTYDMPDPDKLLQLGDDLNRHERARINQDFPYTIRELPSFKKFKEPEEPKKRGLLERVMRCCSCRKNTNKNKFKSKSKKGKKSSKKSSKKGKKSKKSK
jgi:hypothetical protein